MHFCGTTHQRVLHLERLQAHVLEQHGLVECRHQGPGQKLQGWQIFMGLTAQCLPRCGSLEQILWRYFAVRVSSFKSAPHEHAAHGGQPDVAAFVGRGLHRSLEWLQRGVVHIRSDLLLSQCPSSEH